MMENVDWPLVVEVVKVIPAIVVAGVVAVIAYQQWKTAQNKLALDLFDKRFSARQKINDLIEKRSRESAHEADDLLGAYYTPLAGQLDREICEARFLFGEEVFQNMVKISVSLEAVVRANTKVDRDRDLLLDDPVFERWYDERSRALRDVSRAKQEVETLLEPFLLLDKISVNRPRR